LGLIAELRRRNVFRVAIAYVAVGWLVLQAAALLVDVFELPNVAMRLLIALLVLGFIPAMVFSWLYELTPEGFKRESEVDRDASVTRLTGRKLDFVVIGVLGAVVALLLVDKFLVSPRRLATAEPVAAIAPEAAVAPVAAPASADTSIAVLPFIDLSQARDQEYFSDGLSEELLDLLAKVPGLRVIARTSSFSFKGKDADVATIARTLNVSHVLEGSVRKSGNTLRITAQLIRAADSSHLWSETFDREAGDIFKVQDEIAGAVVGALRLKLLGASAQQAVSPEAHDLVLRGRQSYNEASVEGFARSEEMFRKAIALEPNYAAAHAGLARTLVIYADFKPTAAEIAAAKHDARAAADRAIALAPGEADGYEARGFLRAAILWDWKGAEADYDRAIELAPGTNVAVRYRGNLMAALGRFELALADARRASDLDPLSGGPWNDVAAVLLFTEGTSRATREASERACTLNPTSGFAWTNAGTIELLDGKLDAARAAFARADETWTLYGEALVEHAAGNADKAQAALDEYARRYGDGAAFQLAEIHAFRGESDRAFEYLERAYRNRDAGMPYITFSVLLASIREDPRFAAMTQRIGLRD
jgi:TolB-like protein/tetratricopeptide (TPR) repeat protein